MKAFLILSILAVSSTSFVLSQDTAESIENKIQNNNQKLAETGLETTSETSKDTDKTFWQNLKDFFTGTDTDKNITSDETITSDINTSQDEPYGLDTEQKANETGGII